ncbi:MAG: aminoacetone oxidase family FAD-binding enzyme, partial [Acetatifactor sp.]|nr:aminoacetone oxidase family FAD-binding enzyme [Acetatifactor sp.]
TGAIAAARAGVRVVLLERGDRPGKKLLMTGNGKCNLGNRDLNPSNYYSDNMAMAASVLERFGTEETIAFFASLGLMVRERRGYLYPASEQAAVVLDVLRYGLEREGVTVLTQAMVRELFPYAGASTSDQSRKYPVGRDQGCQAAPDPAQGYILQLEGGHRLWAGRVVLACGGQAAPRTGSDGNGYALARSMGHQVIPPVPSLVQLHCSEKYCKALAGVRAEGTVRIYWDKPGGDLIMEEPGEIQLTEYGISGIPVFQLSGGVNQLLAQGKKLRAELDFFPQYETDVYEQLCRRRMERAGGETVEIFFTGMLHKKIMNVCIRQAGLSPEQDVAGADRQRLWQVFDLCRRLSFTITGSHPFDSAQVCRGGVSMREVDSQLQSRRSPGLYLAGELLHVDGRCGGYNLQWAWASGYIAGSAAAAIDKAPASNAG